MSVKLMAQVWDLALAAEQQQVMLALADHAHDDGSRCFPGVEYLAWKVGKSDRAVSRILGALRENGLIIGVAYLTGGRGHATEYAINISAGHRKAPFIRKGDVLSPFTEGESEALNPDAGDSNRTTPASPFKRKNPDADDTLSAVGPELKGDTGGEERVTPVTQRVTPVVIKGDAGVTPTINNHQEPSEVNHQFIRAERAAKESRGLAPIFDAFSEADLNVGLLRASGAEQKAAKQLLSGGIPPSDLVECWQDIRAKRYGNDYDVQHLSFAHLVSRNLISNWQTWRDAGKPPPERIVNGHAKPQQHALSTGRPANRFAVFDNAPAAQ